MESAYERLLDRIAEDEAEDEALMDSIVQDHGDRADQDQDAAADETSAAQSRFIAAYRPDAHAWRQDKLRSLAAAKGSSPGGIVAELDPERVRAKMAQYDGEYRNMTLEAAYAAFRAAFQEFAGLYGGFLHGVAHEQQQELRRSGGHRIAPRLVSSLFTRAGGGVKYTAAVIETLATKPENPLLGTLKFDPADDDTKTLERLSKLDTSDLDGRMRELAGMYMDVRRQATEGQIAHNADGRSAAARRYELWTKRCFSGSWFKNAAATYLFVDQKRRVQCTVEAFSMEMLYIVFTTLLLGLERVRAVNVPGDELAVLARITQDVDYQIQNSLRAMVARMRQRREDSGYYAGVFVGSALATAGLLATFVMLPINLPGLAGALSFMSTVGYDAATQLAENVENRAADWNAKPVVEQMRTFFHGVGTSALFRAYMREDKMFRALAVRNVAKAGEAAWVPAGGGRVPAAGTWAALLAVVLAAAALGA